MPDVSALGRPGPGRALQHCLLRAADTHAGPGRRGLAAAARLLPWALARPAPLLQVAGLQAAELIVVLGDAHVYLNHVKPLEQQLAQQPFAFPVRSHTP